MKIEDDIQAFGAFQHSQFRFLKSVSFSRDVGPNGSSNYEVEVVLSRGAVAHEQDLRLRCTGATDVKLGDINGMHAILLSIRDINSRQLEGIRFRVVEGENDSFSFNCASFSLELIRD